MKEHKEFGALLPYTLRSFIADRLPTDVTNQSLSLWERWRKNKYAQVQDGCPRPRCPYVVSVTWHLSQGEKHPLGTFKDRLFAKNT